MTDYEINGFIVVRKPEYDGTFFEDGWMPDPATRHGRKYYGIERGQWEDIAEGYYTSQLNSKLKNIFEKINNSTKGTLIGLMLSRDLEETKTILEFSNKTKEGLCEIIAFESPIVTSLQGKFETQAEIYWIGYDVLQVGATSLIRNGVFRCGQFFQKWKDKLNNYGLLAERNEMFDELIEDYRFFEKMDLIEDLVNYENIDSVRIGIVVVR